VRGKHLVSTAKSGARPPGRVSGFLVKVPGGRKIFARQPTLMLPPNLLPLGVLYCNQLYPVNFNDFTVLVAREADVKALLVVGSPGHGSSPITSFFQDLLPKPFAHSGADSSNENAGVEFHEPACKLAPEAAANLLQRQDYHRPPHPRPRRKGPRAR